MGFEVTYAAAALAGILSFASPCVLPLVPPYLCFLGGVTLEQIAGHEPPARGVARRVFWQALAFVLGFATVFVALGASASAVSQLLSEHAGWLGRIAGALIVVFGLHFIGIVRIPLLYREARLHVDAAPASLAGAYLIGLAFAFGWTPCIGPVLATVLTVAAAKDSAWEGAALLAVYALGIGIPFLAAALFVRPFLGAMKRLRPHMRAVETAMGALLVATGALMLLGAFQEIGLWLYRTVPVFGTIG
jgi:cytochrome c-type biogenesis protein